MHTYIKINNREGTPTTPAQAHWKVIGHLRHCPRLPREGALWQLGCLDGVSPARSSKTTGFYNGMIIFIFLGDGRGFS